ncbi:MAG TPA: GDSL-type esterase/lipase family protein [Chitinophagales bacterium]
MKKTVLIVFILPILLAATHAKKQRVIFFGDSITANGGFIRNIEENLKSKKLQDKYELLNAGVGNEKVYDLYLRLEDDVLAKKPDVVVILVGTNDIWHKADGTGTDIITYEKFYKAIIKKLQAQNIKVVLCTLTVIGEQKEDIRQYRAMDIYSDVIRRLAQTMSCSLVDLRKAFVEYEAVNNKNNEVCCFLTSDWVHLNETGDKLVATEMLNVLNF